MAGYWPHSFLASLWTSTPSWSINTQSQDLIMKTVQQSIALFENCYPKVSNEYKPHYSVNCSSGTPVQSNTK